MADKKNPILEKDFLHILIKYKSELMVAALLFNQAALK